jgi:Fe-S cluster assembly scaffold protein SufB
MSGFLSAALDFEPTPALLAEVLGAMEELGPRGGGAVAADVRRRALRAFAGAVRDTHPPQWRHDYSALSYDGLTWSSGRLRAPRGARGEFEAAGVVHIGSTYLEPDEPTRAPGVWLGSLADAQRRDRARVGAVQHRIVAPDTDRFTALATAFQNCGAYVEIPDGLTVEEPVQLVWMSAPGTPRAVFPHTVVRVGAGARVTIVERQFAGEDAFVAGIVEAELGPGARLDYVVVQRADETARLFGRRAARCGPDAHAGWHLAEIGGTRVRSVASVELAGAGAVGRTNALAFPCGFAHTELIAEADHAMTRTDSRILVRSAATGHGRGRLGGAVRFAPNVRACDASMRHDGLILARDAFVDTTPTVVVPTNHVSASQAVSIGSLGEDELFYVQSRGISRVVAQQMMALAFFEAAIVGFPTDDLRDDVRTALEQRLDEVPDTFDS